MRLGLLLGIVLVAAACGDGATTGVIETPDAATRFEVEVADSGGERARGLMNRSSLPENAGMLFVYDEPTTGGYWMKDTLIPLSIAFMDGNGRILRILDMEPCRADPCAVYDPGVTYASALEVNRGALGRAGVREGDVLRIHT
jgi:uncharacterized membrane protein (UPF0127 family)